MKKLLILLLIFSIVGCKNEEKPNNIQTNNIYYDDVMDIFDDSIPMMNTIVRLKVENGNTNDFYEQTYKEMEKWHKLLDANHYYRDDEDNLIHNIKILNDAYGQNVAIDVSEDLIQVLDEAINMMKLTQGYFNPFLGSVSELWKPRFSSFPLYNEDPSSDEIQEALACTISFDQVDDTIIIDRKNNTIQFNKVEGCNGKVSINLGAFAKGYISDKVTTILKENEGAWLLDAGMSTVVGYDSSNEHTWLAGARSPYNKSSSLYAFNLFSNEFLSTSGDDFQYFLIDNNDGTNTIRCHIINPFTGMSESYYRSVNVITKGYGAVSDVLSTTLFSIQDKKLAKEIIETFEKEYDTEISVAYTIETNQELHLLVDKDFETHILEETMSEEIKNIELIKE